MRTAETLAGRPPNPMAADPQALSLAPSGPAQHASCITHRASPFRLSKNIQEEES